ncbi:MAG: ABC transporter permease subunit [Nitriliruptoraceae bacterium]
MAADRTLTDASTTSPSSGAAPTGASGPDGSRRPGHPLAAVPSAGALPVLRWVLRVHRRALIGWGVALGLVTALYVSFWPAMGDTQEMQALIDSMPEALVTAMGYDAISSPAGYLESTVYALLAPILMLVFALAFGARLIAGDEESGAMELEATGPVGRRRVLLERYAALVLGVVWLGALTGVVALTLARALGMDIGTGPLLGATVGLGLLVLALGSVAFAVGAATGRRALALTVGATVAVFGYMADALAPLLDDGAWLERLSPFFWYLGNDPLNEGLGVAGALALAALTLVSLGVAVLAYDRRDLGV